MQFDHIKWKMTILSEIQFVFNDHIFIKRDQILFKIVENIRRF